MCYSAWFADCGRLPLAAPLPASVLIRTTFLLPFLVTGFSAPSANFAQNPIFLMLGVVSLGLLWLMKNNKDKEVAVGNTGVSDAQAGRIYDRSKGDAYMHGYAYFYCAGSTI